MAPATGLEWLWLGINGVLGVPAALALLVLARELLRGLVALILGFRVFEIQWGVGPVLIKRPIGPIDLALARIPVAGRAIVRSGMARRHRLGLILVAAAPLAPQVGWLVLRSWSSPGFLPSLMSGPAPLATLDIANALLLALHLMLPIQLSRRVGTDLRLLVDALLGHADANRTARASYYARLARLRIERSDVQEAQQVLEQGLVQLGREPMLVACDARLRESDLSSVVDQGECADAMGHLIEESESACERDVGSWPLGERMRRAAIMAAPLGLMAIALGASQADRLASHLESRWRHASDLIATRGDPDQCAQQVADWAAWAQRVDPWLPPASFERSDRHLAFARLERCAGDLQAAAGHQGEALLAANAARTELASTLPAQPERWLENELRLAKLFRHAAAVESDRRAYRQALLALTNAENRLDTVRRQIGLWPEAEARSQAEQTIVTEQAELLAMREQVMTRLAGRL